MNGICKQCGKVKPLHGVSYCGSCYNKQRIASKPPEEQERIRKHQSELKTAWQKARLPENARYMKLWREAHPEYKEKTIVQDRLSLAKLQREAPIKTLEKQGINTEFMRGQLEEHRKNKLALKIQSGMDLMQ